jgi:hypothetical protein
MEATVKQVSLIREAGSKSSLKEFAPGLLALLSAFPLAALIHLVNENFSANPERAVLVTGIIFAGLMAVPAAAYILMLRGAVDPYRLGTIVIASAAVLLSSIYLYWVSFYVFFPADFLIWSESDFVNDILKFRAGYPLYTAQANNESFTYVPGTQLLTYMLAWLTGHATSVPAYRVIQLCYTLLAAVAAVCCCRRLVLLSIPEARGRDWRLWGMVLAPTLFLIATNSLTNPFVHNLHNDALAQLITLAAYWALLEYIARKDRRLLILMALIPAAGFLVKQSLSVWAVFYCIHLGLFEKPRSFSRLAAFAVASFGAIGAVVGTCYLIWSDDFIYWVFTVLGSHGVSPLRAFQHVLDVWPYFAIGLLGGAVLLRGKSFNALLSPWLIWLALITSETYTSGVAWMLNHIGPGCLIAGVWFCAALIRIWPRATRASNIKGPVQAARQRQAWLRAAAGVCAVLLLLSGLKVVRIPLRPFSGDVYRYVNEIEREFGDSQAKETLLDMGTWVYMKDAVVMKDRAPSIGERGYSETGDFSGVIGRIEQKQYSKILVRSLHSADFWYDHELWPRSSGIREKLMENYREVGRIPAATGADTDRIRTYGFSEISVLIPRSD